MLQVGIVDEDTNHARFKHVKVIDLANHVTFSKLDGQLVTRQGQHHDLFWDAVDSRPPWRIEVFTTDGASEVMFSFHHSLLDGTSGRLFHEKLLAQLNSPSEPDDSPELHVSPTPLPAPQEEDVNFTISPLYMVRTLWNELGPGKFFASKPTFWSSRKVDFALPYITRIIPVDITASTVTKLLEACRAHSTSITALVHALALASCAKRLAAAEAPSFSATTPISLRPFLRSDANEAHKQMLRVLVTGSDQACSAAEVSRFRDDKNSQDALIWDAAKRLKGELNRRVEILPGNDIAGLMKFVSDWFGFWRKLDGKPRKASWEVSNIGVLRPTDGGYSISRIFFTNGAMVAGAAFSLGVASVAGGQMTIGISWQEGNVNEALMTAVAEDLNGYVDSFVKSGKFA